MRVRVLVRVHLHDRRIGLPEQAKDVQEYAHAHEYEYEYEYEHEYEYEYEYV